MKKHYYLITIQYLGFRYSGWFTQKDQTTVQGMVDKTVKFVLGHDNFKTLGASRTDAKVSANETFFELFIDEPLNIETFLPEFDKNLPPDIRAIDIREVSATFNIIQTPKEKEYIYLFSFGQRAHPFSASMMASFVEELHIDLMMQGAKLFEGVHNFKPYCARSSEKQHFEREVTLCQIEENKEYTASFFPEKSYLLRVKGKGFLRYQIRLMMGQILRLGRGEINLNDIRASLDGTIQEPIPVIAPGSGLILKQTILDA